MRGVLMSRAVAATVVFGLLASASQQAARANELEKIEELVRTSAPGSYFHSHLEGVCTVLPVPGDKHLLELTAENGRRSTFRIRGLTLIHESGNMCPIHATVVILPDRVVLAWGDASGPPTGAQHKWISLRR